MYVIFMVFIFLVSGGAGGKGVWGKLGSELLEEYEDFNDPNYDSETCNNGDIELKIVFPALSREELQVFVSVFFALAFISGTAL